MKNCWGVCRYYFWSLDIFHFSLTAYKIQVKPSDLWETRNGVRRHEEAGYQQEFGM